MRASWACAFGVAVVIAATAVDVGCSSASTASATVSKGSSGGDSGCKGVVLTVKDVPISSPGCLVSISGGEPVGAGVRTVCVPLGVTTLSATPFSKHALAPRGTWHETDGDTGAGDEGTVSAGTSTTTVTTNTPGTRCVWACCPSNAGSQCPTTNQCP